MTYKNNIDYILKVFHLSEKKLKKILNIDKKVDIYKCDDNTKEIVAGFFYIDKHILENDNELPLLQCIIPIDKKKYKNMVSMYSILLKEYFSTSEIYILTKIKQRKGISSIINLFFNSKKSVINEMKSFTPSYLIDDQIKLLVSIDSNNMYVYQLPNGIDTNVFIFNNYKYKKANRLNI